MRKTQDLRIVLCTFSSMEEARQIGTSLVEKQLAACVNLLTGVESIYRWNKEVKTDREVLGIFKTTRSGLRAFSEAITELHSYEVPEILAFTPEEAAGAYADWVMASVTPQ